MAGHSKWANIKHRKGAQDKKRAQLFTKLIRAVRVAAQEGGPDPDTNATLAVAIERAKAFNVPKETIARALSKEEGERVQELAFDAIGPGGVQIIIECATDNPNRTISEVRHLVEKRHGKITQHGAARWAFRRAGMVFLPKEQVEDEEAATLALIDAGVDDVLSEEGALVALTDPAMLAQVAQQIRDRGFPVADAMLGWHPTHRAEPLPPESAQRLRQLCDALEEHPDVQAVWTNAPERTAEAAA